MIEMPRFPEEEWYIEQIKSLFMSKKNNKKFEEFETVIKLNKLIDSVINPSDLKDVTLGETSIEKIAIAPFSVLKKFIIRLNPIVKKFFKNKSGKYSVRHMMRWSTKK